MFASVFALVPSLAVSASTPRVAKPRLIPACTVALLSQKDLAPRSVQTCLSMMGRARVTERCSGGSEGYLIDTMGWAGISAVAEADWALRVGHRPHRLTAPAYDPQQLRSAVCG